MSVVKYFASSRGNHKSDQTPEVLTKEDKTHPLFGFPSNFFDQLKSITPVQLGQAVPYISVKVVDEQGEVLIDLNTNFFFVGRDEKAMEQQIRHSERPIMSLQEVSIKTTNASGYLYYTDVDLSIRIHAPNFLTDSVMLSFIVPNAPLMLEYGWSVPDNQPHPLQDVTQKLKFQVVTYEIGVDEMNQMTLVVKGKAFNDVFNNTYLGDDGNVEAVHASQGEMSNIQNYQAILEKTTEYLREYARQGKQQKHDYDLVRRAATAYKGSEKKTRRSLSVKLKNRKKALDDLDTKATSYTLHDVISTLCHETFSTFATSVMQAREFRVIYGDTNEHAGKLKNKSLADFKVDRERFDNLFREIVETGQLVPTLKVFLDAVTREFLEEQDVWEDQTVATETFYKPEIVLNFTNRGDIAELHILDIKQGLPATINKIPEGSAPIAEAEASVIDGTGLSVLEIGHANSFVKKVSLNQISDQAMKAAFIARMNEERQKSIRSSKTVSTASRSRPVTPLFLPLQGSIEVLGHVEWAPFRAFYLSTGLFIVDGVYKILGVTHKLSPNGFTTSLDLIYN